MPFALQKETTATLLLLTPRFSDFLRTWRQRWEIWLLAGLSHPDPEIAEHLARWLC